LWPVSGFFPGIGREKALLEQQDRHDAECRTGHDVAQVVLAEHHAACRDRDASDDEYRLEARQQQRQAQGRAQGRS